MSKKVLKDLLQTYDKKQLIGLVTELYNKNKAVKEFLDYYINPDEKEALKNFKVKVKEAFYPSRGDRIILSMGKKAISDFRQLKPSTELLIDLMMYYVETGVQCTCDFGDINESFYLSIEGVYGSVMKLIRSNKLEEAFKDRAFECVRKTENCGWGFHDTLGDLCYETYGESMNSIQYKNRPNAYQ